MPLSHKIIKKGDVREWRDRAKRKKGLIDMVNIVAIAGGAGTRGPNDNGKNTIKIRKQKRNPKLPSWEDRQ